MVCCWLTATSRALRLVAMYLAALRPWMNGCAANFAQAPVFRFGTGDILVLSELPKVNVELLPKQGGGSGRQPCRRGKPGCRSLMHLGAGSETHGESTRHPATWNRGVLVSRIARGPRNVARWSTRRVHGCRIQCVTTRPFGARPPGRKCPRRRGFGKWRLPSRVETARDRLSG